jgi:hypothetical protein
MKTFIAFYGAVIASGWYWAIHDAPSNRWVKPILLLIAGAGIGSYLYDVVTICILPASSKCTWL